MPTSIFQSIASLFATSRLVRKAQILRPVHKGVPVARPVRFPRPPGPAIQRKAPVPIRVPPMPSVIAPVKIPAPSIVQTPAAKRPKMKKFYRGQRPNVPQPGYVQYAAPGQAPVSYEHMREAGFSLPFAHTDAPLGPRLPYGQEVKQAQAAQYMGRSPAQGVAKRVAQTGFLLKVPLEAAKKVGSHVTNTAPGVVSSAPAPEATTLVQAAASAASSEQAAAASTAVSPNPLSIGGVNLTWKHIAIAGVIAYVILK